MYSKTPNHVTFFADTHNEHTEKVTYGRVSEAFDTGKKDAEGKSIFEFETTNARFVGKAREKALALKDKTKITLTEWSARNPYNKETKRSYPYLMVMDFEVRDQGATENG